LFAHVLEGGQRLEPALEKLKKAAS
jgi:hypothetical protein